MWFQAAAQSSAKRTFKVKCFARALNAAQPSAKCKVRKCKVRTGNGGGHEAGHIAGNHCAEHEARDVSASRRRHRADRSDHYTHRTRIREAAQRVRRDHFRLLLRTRICTSVCNILVLFGSPNSGTFSFSWQHCIRNAVYSMFPFISKMMK